MSRHVRRFFLALGAVVFGAMLILVLAEPELARNPRPPRGLPAMAAWLAEHPADYITASAISDAALDSNVPRRLELWRAAQAHSHKLAPTRNHASTAFVRAGLFHWYELSEPDRRAVLATAEPLLRDDPRLFAEVHFALWQLTHDFSYLRRAAPDNLNALDQLRTVAASYGLFAEYRDLRAAIRRKKLEIFRAQRETLTPAELIRLVPMDADVGDEPLIRGVLEELQRRSIVTSQLPGESEGLIVYAIEHGFRPLDGFAPVIESNHISAPARARLALAIGKADAATRVELSNARRGAQEWVPYYLERALYEARRGNRGMALAQLSALTRESDPIVLAAAEQVMNQLGDREAAARYRQQLLANPQPDWQNACGPLELCERVRGRVYAANGSIALPMSVVQSDQTPPYVEIYVDDARVAEGEVPGDRTFVLPASDGLHEIEVRLINSRMRNGFQRRVRLSRSTVATAAPAMAARVAGFEGMKKLKSNSACTIAMVRLARAAA